MLKRRPFAACLLLAILVLITSQPGLIQASEDSTVSLEQAINLVKDNFNIPPEFKDFRSGYSSSNGNTSWTLNWMADEGAGGSFDAQVDTLTGEIISINLWRNNWTATPSAQIPKISRIEAQASATELMNRLASRYIGELQLVSGEDDTLPISSYGPGNYTIRWQRIAQGLPFPNDGVTIMVRSDDGSISSYQLNWTKAALPDASSAISSQQAIQAFSQAGMLELSYIRPFRTIPLASGEKPAVLLVYQLLHRSGGIIDALSGKPLEMTDNIDRYGFGGDGAGILAMDQAKQISQVENNVLSDEEIKEIEKTTRLISQNQALEAVQKWINIPSGLSLKQANLMSQTGGLATHVWNLSWSSGSPDDKGDGESIHAMVNAQNGELLSFYTYYPDYGSEPGIIDREAARSIGEKFLRQVQPERFSSTRYFEAEQRLWAAQEDSSSKPSQQYFEYRRVVNQVPFYGNYISVRVDAVNQRVIEYNLSWENLDFPSKDNILSSQQAVDAFLNSRPLTLSYYQESNYDAPGKIHLVYQPLSEGGAYTILDAKNGQLLDWQGNPAKQHRALVFNDIENNFAAAEITLLGQAGLFGEYGTSFHPDENVSVVSLLRAMLKSSDWGFEGLNDDQVMSQARSRGWLKEDLKAGEAVSREILARFMVRFLNLERATHAQGIYQVPYADADSWPEGLLAYAALCNGLGVISGDGVNFDPGHTVSRAEAASALVRALRVEP